VNESFESAPPPPVPPPAPVISENLVSPVVTYVLVGFTIFIYIIQVATNYFLGADLPAFLGMKINQFIIQGQIWRLITPMFLHGPIFHIGFNMYALIIFGSELERRFGHWRFLLLYFMGSFGGNVLSFLISPSNSYGASTAIFGLLGAEIVFFYQNRKLFGAGARRALQSAITVAGINLLIGLSPGIDNWGHLGGLIGGLIFTWFAGPSLIMTGQYPFLKVEDERGLPDQVLGAGLVILFFGTLAAMKILGLGPF
jgi:rhomboid protease GluP